MVKSTGASLRFGRRTVLFLIVGIVLACLGLAAGYWGHVRSKPAGSGSIDKFRRQRSVLQEIRGFRFEGQCRGHRVLSITADRFTICKKKLGVFRFGLMNEARFENAVIRLYGFRETVSSDSTRCSTPAEAETHFENSPVRFDGVFSTGALPRLPAKRIVGLEMTPVTVELGDDQSVMTRISASSATFCPEKKEILFRGNVRMATDKRALHTDRLRLLPLDGIVSTDRSFRLTGPGGRLKGRRMAADLLLRSIGKLAERPADNYREIDRLAVGKELSERQSNR